MSKIQKLELTWVGKNEQEEIEPRILVENPELSHIYETAANGQVKMINDDGTFENMLIHGDNLLALKALEQDFAGQVKCIYIDPPYNTGSAFEKYDDNKEHSIWLNLMDMRLKILYNLLSEDGKMFVSIDDSEVAYLQVLLDSIFGRNNFVANLPTIMNLKGNQDQYAFAGTHEYTLVYCKDKEKAVFNMFPIDEDELEKEWEEDEIGYFKKGATLRATGEEQKRTDRPKMFYPILVKDGIVEAISIEEYKKIFSNGEFDDNFLNNLIEEYKASGYIVVLPMESSTSYGRWRWGFDTFLSNYRTEIIATKSGNSYSFCKKQRPSIGDIPTKKPKTLFYKAEYSSGNGTAQIKKLFGYNAFPYPKPEELIKDILTIGSNPGDLVLDSFLGSGTTCAVAQKLGRKWIGIEMGDHAYTHCKVRLDKVISGEDQGGISKSINWQGGGSYRFYELAPSLVVKDKYGKEIINPEYNANMLAAAMAKHEGFKYSPDKENVYKQGFASEKSFIFTTTTHLTAEYLDEIATHFADDEFLVINCKSFDGNISNNYKNIKIKKIPQSILGKCVFGKDNYNLNIINLPTEEE